MKDGIVTQFNYRETSNPRQEKVSPVSVTDPSQHVPLDELLRRYSRGQNVEVFEATYNDDFPFHADLQRMDKLDKLEMARDIRHGIERARATSIVKASSKKKQELDKGQELDIEPVTE